MYICESQEIRSNNVNESSFDFMVMLWVFRVLKAKGVDQAVIDRLMNIYGDNITVVVVNNIPGRAFINLRWSMRQGNLQSAIWFSYGIDPLLSYLDKRLMGIPIYSTPTLGPVLPTSPPLPDTQETFRLIAYVDDVKPAITSMQEFLLVDNASLLFEKASGCELHRDPLSGKVSFSLLAVGVVPSNRKTSPYPTLPYLITWICLE